jgi:hypothetical protein
MSKSGLLGVGTAELLTDVVSPPAKGIEKQSVADIGPHRHSDRND